MGKGEKNWDFSQAKNYFNKKFNTQNTPSTHRHHTAPETEAEMNIYNLNVLCNQDSRQGIIPIMQLAEL